MMMRATQTVGQRRQDVSVSSEPADSSSIRRGNVPNLPIRGVKREPSKLTHGLAAAVLCLLVLPVSSAHTDSTAKALDWFNAAARGDDPAEPVSESTLVSPLGVPNRQVPVNYTNEGKWVKGTKVTLRGSADLPCTECTGDSGKFCKDMNPTCQKCNGTKFVAKQEEELDVIKEISPTQVELQNKNKCINVLSKDLFVTLREKFDLPERKHIHPMGKKKKLSFQDMKKYHDKACCCCGTRFKLGESIQIFLHKGRIHAYHANCLGLYCFEKYYATTDPFQNGDYTTIKEGDKPVYIHGPSGSKWHIEFLNKRGASLRSFKPMRFKNVSGNDLVPLDPSTVQCKGCTERIPVKEGEPLY